MLITFGLTFLLLRADAWEKLLNHNPPIPIAAV
jgi:hypothetical protein